MASKKSRGIRSNIQTKKLQSNLGGISQNRDERFLVPSEAQDIVNMHSIKDGTWSSDKAGYSHLNDTAVESGAVIDGVHWFTDATGVDFLLLASNGKLKKINTGSGVVTDADASAAMTAGNPVDFQNYNGVVYFCDGSIATPRKFDGSTGANSGGWPVSDGVNNYDTPKYVELHQNRVVYGGMVDYPDHVIISDQGDGENFTQPAVTAADSFITEVAPGDGGVITGMRSLTIPNSNDDILVVFKSRGIYSIVGRSGLAGDADEFKVVRINGEFGAFNNRCIVQVGQDLLAISEYGIVSYTSASTSGTVQPIGVNVNRVRDVIDRVNLNVREKCWAIHLKDRREVWFGLPTGSSTQVNEFIVYKYPDPGEQGSSARWSRRTGFTSPHGVLYGKDFYIGTYTGYIGYMFNSSKYNETGINWVYEYPYWDLGNELQYKRITHAEAHFRLRSNHTVSMTTTWKGGGNNDTLSQSLDVNTTVGGALYGAGVYGSSVYGERDEVTREFNVPGNGKRLKYKLSGTTTTTGVEFLGLSMQTEVGSLSSHWN